MRRNLKILIGFISVFLILGFFMHLVLAQEVYYSEPEWNGVVNKFGGTNLQTFDRNASKSTLSICKLGLCYFRTDNPLSFELGRAQKSSEIKGDIDWDISGIPMNSEILEISLRLFIENVPIDMRLDITHMGGGNENYPDEIRECDGNCQFFNDIGDGEVYNTQVYSAGNDYEVLLDLDAIDELESDISSGNEFSTGLNPEYNNLISISSTDNPDISKRPLLTVVYNLIDYANETEGDDATQVGILSALPGTEIKNDQIVNLVLDDGTQYLGTFDKYASFNSQRWAFNYVTEDEEFTEMQNASTRFFVSEFEDLSASQIIEYVIEFISNTID